MLIELRIENLAVVERLEIEPGPGLNVLTGETGTGKSLIVGALSLLLGERASSDAVRSGVGRAVVEGVFDVTAAPQVRSRLENAGIASDEVAILRREIAAGGRSRAWINGAACTATLVGEIGSLLIDLHGQSDHQSLVRPSVQRDILDAFADSHDLAAEAQSAYEDLDRARERLDLFETEVRELDKRSELLAFQASEIEGARLRAHEDEQLQAEVTRLEHAEEIARLASRLHDAAYASDEAVAGRIDDLRRDLARITRFEPSLDEWRKTLDDAYFSLQEFGRHIGAYAARSDHDPARLQELRERIDLLFRLKSKYGPGLDDVIATGARAREVLAAVVQAGDRRADLESRIRAATHRHVEACSRLSERRTAAARRLSVAVAAALPDLGMPDAVFQVRSIPLPEPGPHGAESIRFEVSINAGFEPGPIGSIASGGELSRIMLALKATLASADPVGTLIFDEIDAGIGGQAAHRVAERLRQVATHHQVLVVTHLAQIAVQADHHFLVEKSVDEGLAAASLRRLHGEARVHELARLLGGDPESEISRAHARELQSAFAGEESPPDRH
jgi:DNA repair protein RecN (Recombination protein N)